MLRTNRDWLPFYCNPDALLPKIPETRALFQWKPYLIQDFIGKSISFLESDDVRKLGFDWDYRRVVPCRWKCSDESLFGVDLAIWAHTRAYPFDKGMIGGRFNPGSLGAAVHHGSINVDIGGSHVGYVPGSGGGSFGRIWRPAEQQYSTDCGYLCALLAPFIKVYEDACKNIRVYRPMGERALVSIPNEYVQPTWSSERVKLLVDLERFTDGEVDYVHSKSHTHTQLGRSLFYLNRDFLEHLDEETARRCCSPTPTRIGSLLGHRYFNIWDSEAEVHNGLPEQRLLPYIKFILAAQHSPTTLKAAVVNTAIEHNRLTDTVRSGDYRDYDFVSFSGVFIDHYSDAAKAYVNLFMPMGMTVKPRGRTREVEFSPEEIHDIFQKLPSAEPRIPLESIFDYERPDHILEEFTFEPGKFSLE